MQNIILTAKTARDADLNFNLMYFAKAFMTEI